MRGVGPKLGGLGPSAVEAPIPATPSEPTAPPTTEAARPLGPSTTAADRSRVSTAGRLPPALAGFDEAIGLGARVDAFRAGKPGIALDERPRVRAELEQLDRAQLSKLRAVLALEPPHPQLKAMRGHPALKGPPTVEGVLSLMAGEPLGVAETRAARARGHTQVEAPSPSPNLLPPGAPVRVRRSSGALDDGWSIRSRAPDGDLIVAKPQEGMTKKLSASRLLLDNLERLAPGTPVLLRRSSGQLDAWEVGGAQQQGNEVKVRVFGPGSTQKDVDLTHLLGLNPQLLGDGPPPGTAGKIFAPGQSVRVRRSNGALDEGWTTLGYDPVHRQIRVVSGDMSKHVQAEDLLNENPELIPMGTPLVMPRSSGQPEDGWVAVSGSPAGVAALGPNGDRKRVPVADLLPLNPHLLETDPAQIVSGGPARIDSSGQSARFQASHVIGPGERIVDGYVDGGRGMREDGRGAVTSGREILVVDRARDRRLQSHLSFARSLKDLPPAGRTRALLEYVNAQFNRPDGRASVSASERLADQFAGREVMLGEVAELSGSGVCRHRALLLKVLGDEAGLDVTLQRGNADFGPGARGGHAWNVVAIEGKDHLVDSMNPTLHYGNAQLVPLDDPSLKNMYLDMQDRPLYGGPS